MTACGHGQSRGAFGRYHARSLFFGPLAVWTTRLDSSCSFRRSIYSVIVQAPGRPGGLRSTVVTNGQVRGIASSTVTLMRSFPRACSLFRTSDLHSSMTNGIRAKFPSGEESENCRTRRRTGGSPVLGIHGPC